MRAESLVDLRADAKICTEMTLGETAREHSTGFSLAKFRLVPMKGPCDRDSDGARGVAWAVALGTLAREGIVSEKWRHLGDLERENFLLWAEKNMRERSGPHSAGRQKYGDTFQGDPVEQLAEEVFDALFYAWVALRRLKGQVTE
jgi:hypothetical protein